MFSLISLPVASHYVKVNHHRLNVTDHVTNTTVGYQVDDDLIWNDALNSWHQRLARIVDHRFSTFDELLTFALNAKKAGVSALMLVQIQKTEACPGSWWVREIKNN